MPFRFWLKKKKKKAVKEANSYAWSGHLFVWARPIPSIPQSKGDRETHTAGGFVNYSTCWRSSGNLQETLLG